MSVTVHLAEQPEVEVYRKSEHGVSPLFLNRWSSRAYADRKVSDEDLYSILEAAHWAPSSYNDQPWRFYVANTEERLQLFRQFLNPFNQSWASKAPVLVLVASDTKRENGDPNGAHAFDAGAAWGHMALQALLLGLSTHAIGGFDRDEARRMLQIPDSYELHAIISIGYRGEKEMLDAILQEREHPNTRKPLQEVVFEK